jgi:hypothetical protein
MKIAFIVLGTFAALLALVGATAMAQTPADNAKAVMGELTEVKGSLLYDYWLSVFVNKVKVGYAHVVSEKAADEKEVKSYKITTTTVFQTASGKVTVTEKAILSPRFQLSSRTWGTQGTMHGFVEIREDSNHTFSWTDSQVKITNTEKGKEGENVSVLSTALDTICQISFLYPLLAKKGPAKYAFSVLDIDYDKIDSVNDAQVEVLVAKEMKIRGKIVEAVEVRRGDDSMFFGKDGAFLMHRDGPRQYSAALSKVQAQSDLVPFDPEGDTDWTSVTKPVDVILVFSYAMIKKDKTLFEKVFCFRRFFKSLIEANGQPVDNATLDRMMSKYKPRMIEQMLKTGESGKAFYLLSIIPSAMSVKMLSQDKAVVTLLGEGKEFTVDKVDGAWMIVKLN